MWSAGVQREVPFGFIVDVTYVGRRGLYLPRERNINQLRPGTCNPQVNIAAQRPYKGYGLLRLSENAARSMYNSLQVSVDRRYSNGLKVGLAYTLGKSTDNGSDKRNVLWDPYDDTSYEGPSNFDRRHALSIYYIYDLPFWREPTNLIQNLLGGWQISGAAFMRTGTPFTITRSDDRAGIGPDSSIGLPIDMNGDPFQGTNGKFSGGVTGGVAADDNFYFNPARLLAGAGRREQVREHAPQRGLQPRRSAVGPRDLQERQARGEPSGPDSRGDVQLHQSPEPERPDHGPHQRELRPHHHEVGRSPRHSARASVHVLGLHMRRGSRRLPLRLFPSTANFQLPTPKVPVRRITLWRSCG